MSGRAISENEAEKWGEVYGKQCVKTHNCYPDEITCRGTLERTCAVFRRSFDETAFRAFFAAAKRAANDARAETMNFEIRQTSDRNGKLYEITLHGRILGDADDEKTAERVKDIIVAAFKAHGELTHAARSAAENALRDAGLETTANLFLAR
jgi:hypothetical protein